MDTIQFMSDLHLESPASSYDIFEITPTAPYLALLGDIGNTSNPGLLTFLTTQLSQFKIVFYLLGNHEPYHSSWEQSRTTLRTFQKECEANPSLGRFVFLDQTRFDLSPTVTILGCPLFSRILPDQADFISCGLNDFYHIENWTVPLHNAAFTSDLTWLNTQVSLISKSEPERKIIILTHHGPTTDMRVVDPGVVGSKLSSGFLSDLKGEVCWESGNVRVWGFGHTHFNADYLDVGVGWEGREMRVVTNQRGYYFKQAEGFDGGKVIRL